MVEGASGMSLSSVMSSRCLLSYDFFSLHFFFRCCLVAIELLLSRLLVCSWLLSSLPEHNTMDASFAARRTTAVTAASAASSATRRRCAVSPRATPTVAAAGVVGKPTISPLVQVRNEGISC